MLKFTIVHQSLSQDNILEYELFYCGLQECRTSIFCSFMNFQNVIFLNVDKTTFHFFPLDYIKTFSLFGRLQECDIFLYFCQRRIVLWNTNVRFSTRVELENELQTLHKCSL